MEEQDKKAILMNTLCDTSVMRLLQFTDSACPVGAFAFSCGLESAAACGIVHDAVTLGEYVRAVAMQSAFCDAVAALHAHRATVADSYGGVMDADRALMMAKLNDEGRLMLMRMGRKLIELGSTLIKSPLLNAFLSDIRSGEAFGSYPVAQGVMFAVLGIKEPEMFASHQYGVVNMVLGAALRCVKVSHVDTQKILFELMGEVPELYGEIKDFTLDEMNSFCPEVDILVSIHEKGRQRMFMS